MFNKSKTTLFLGMALLLGQVMTQAQAGSTDIANVPMAVSNMVTPNVLVIYDNSESMDAQMNGVMVSGNNPSTRGNIGRDVMRNAITTYRSAFNWGLMSYGMSTNPPTLYSTYAYYLGSTPGMVFTSNCIGYVPGVFNGAPPVLGVSPDGGGRCIANPEPSFGREYITFDKTSDDFDIVDVLYYGGYSGAPAINQAWAPAANTSNPTTYNWYKNHSTAVSTWNPADFSNSWFSSSLTPTDAGFIPGNFGAALPNNISRSLYIPRGWGYLSNITGSGKLNEAAMPDSAAHYTTLQNLLASETSGATAELKNGAVFTPLRGSLQDTKTYFSTSLSSKTSPVQYTCQQNFVMLVTDGLPTGKTDGNLYSTADRTNTCVWSTATNACASGAFGTAATHAISATNALRTTSVSGYTSTNKDGTGAVTGKYDVQTYVVALGDTVANADALSVMNAMAFNGGTDKALPAGDAIAFKNAITRISDDIVAKVGSSAAVAVSNPLVTATDNADFVSKYNSGTWTGDLNSFAIDVATGVETTTSLWTSGSAATQLDLRTPASRFIATSTDVPGTVGGIQFQPTAATTPTKLGAAQEALLGTPPALTDGAAVLAYLRGDRSGESATYRVRAHLLGDIINSEAVMVDAPSANYVDTGYSAFKTAHASRARMLYQGANDGMLHAFNATTGAEAWAYVPNLVMADLNNLSLKVGFSHRYYVDGTPAAADVDFGSANWHTILVGGLGKGGRGYFALDVTTPGAASEAAVASKVLWEFPNSISTAADRTAAILNMGYSFGKPLLVKTAAGWVALVTSGYNNGTNIGDSGGDGLGHLYVINPQTGDLIKDLATTGCTATPASDPCGLAQISASMVGDTTDYVYGGDLKGNLWRFDLTAASTASWSVAKFTTLVDGSGVAQPITAAPAVSIISSMRIVQVGTGQYLGTSDVSTTQTQTMYGLRDSLVALTPLRSNLQQQTVTTAAGFRTSSSNAVDYTTKQGWYMDLPSAGERANTTPATDNLGNLAFTTNIPSATPCVPGGRAWLYALDSKTGGVANFAVNTWSGKSLGDGVASRVTIIRLPDGTNVALDRRNAATDSTAFSKGPPTTFMPSTIKRTWRQLYLY